MSKWLLAFALCCVSLLAHSLDVRTYIPKKAFVYCPAVKAEQEKYFPGVSIPEYFCGLVEQESCLSLTHSRCWDPRSQLLTSKEQGVGLGQLTRAFNKNGSVRFDSLTGMRNAYKADLGDLNWDTVKERPDLQIRTMLLMVRDNYKQLYMIKDPSVRFQFADAGYSGGLRDLRKERMVCGLKAGCDPTLWFGHVETTCVKGTKPLYGNRSACMINREHVHNVFKLRMTKYKQFYQ